MAIFHWVEKVFGKVRLKEGVLAAAGEAPIPERTARAAQEPAAEAIESAMKLISNARLPLIIAGDGVLLEVGRDVDGDVKYIGFPIRSVAALCRSGSILKCSTNHKHQKRPA